MSKFKSLLKKLKEYDIEVSSTDENQRVVYGQFFVIFVEDDGGLDISFHISMPPDEAGVICLILKEIRCVRTNNSVRVGENYLPEKDGTCAFGDEADNKFKKLIQRRIIQNYVTEQKQLEYLINDNINFHA